MNLLIHAYSTLEAPQDLAFEHRAASRRSRRTDNLSDDLNRLRDYCVTTAKDAADTPAIQNLLQHIDRTSHHFSFEIDDAEFATVSKWAWANNAILYFADGTVRDPSGRILMDPASGKPHPDAELPFPADARQRQLQSEMVMRNRLIDPPEVLPPIPGMQEVKPRGADDVAWRCLALFLVAARAESVMAGRPIPLDAIERRHPLALHALTTAEKSFLQLDRPTPDQAAEHCWRYESLYALQWALGMHPELEFADKICDVPTVARLIFAGTESDFVTTAKLRPTEQILDATDLNLRLLWAARDAANRRKDPPAGIDGFVLVERQHALHWLIAAEGPAWDDVDTST
ncbi:DUF4272 domain-containing protein [Crateriforma spongiae]|uniref:DUF4272 domain-containing protein n=1 Tax=Crateriforma spongiae TaxID=2724528 RepID=UPI001446787C|nr:DUF4272 domain-containing protein [Crateriforma spongiae]